MNDTNKKTSLFSCSPFSPLISEEEKRAGVIGQTYMDVVRQEMKKVKGARNFTKPLSKKGQARLGRIPFAGLDVSKLPTKTAADFVRIVRKQYSNVLGKHVAKRMLLPIG
ncbi:hypothetical protein FJZ26_00005 [Candidatus Parvarchaeota archaeon]|nr:hypothetical protein [Candidatus Parvarchaeota archaeon]